MVSDDKELASRMPRLVTERRRRKSWCRRWLHGRLGNLAVCGQTGMFYQALSGTHWSRH